MASEEHWILDNFITEDLLGTGSYSQVNKVRSTATGTIYAVKCIHKLHLIKHKKVKYASIERDAMQKIQATQGFFQRNGGCCVELFATLQDKDSLYFIMEYVPNGDLLQLIKDKPNVSRNESVIAYLASQLMDSIRFIQSEGIIHRDIKPENILFTKDWTIKLTDFGSAKILQPKEDSNNEYNLLTRCNSFVGTAEYVSPELLSLSYVDYRCDYWSFGCILYHLKFGSPPFKGKSEYLTFKLITDSEEVNFPVDDTSKELKHLISNLLIRDMDKRLTPKAIMVHDFFKIHTIDFDDLATIWTPRLDYFS
ncbi:hypothetical protein MOSE0_N03048 [Monosporozyma servazzii]